MQVRRPIVAITMGDPAGIGPEIAAKALARREILEACRPLVVGDVRVMRRAVDIARVPLRVRSIGGVEEARFQPGTMDVLDQGTADPSQYEIGQVSAIAGAAAFAAIERAIRMALAREVEAVVTCPINKEALNRAGYSYAGHTEIFGELTGARDVAMLLVGEGLRVAHVSTHVSLREACDLVKKERILRVIELLHDACLRMGIDEPRIAVAGLNPHSGEGGLFGSEEGREIVPAVEEARRKGIRAEGPIPPDTVFAQARACLFDAVVAMYHDQGHIPLKLLSFRYNPDRGEWQSVSGVNVTLGLPIVRTSVDHGTAFDRAGRGTASEQSLVDAIHLAVKLASTPIPDANARR